MNEKFVYWTLQAVFGVMLFMGALFIRSGVTQLERLSEQFHNHNPRLTLAEHRVKALEQQLKGIHAQVAASNVLLTAIKTIMEQRGDRFGGLNIPAFRGTDED